MDTIALQGLSKQEKDVVKYLGYDLSFTSGQKCAKGKDDEKFKVNLEVLCLKDEADPKFGKFTGAAADGDCGAKVTY